MNATGTQSAFSKEEIIMRYKECRRTLHEHNVSQLSEVLKSRSELAELKAIEFKQFLTRYKQAFFQVLPSGVKDMSLRSFMENYGGDLIQCLNEVSTTQLTSFRDNLPTITSVHTSMCQDPQELNRVTSVEQPGREMMETEEDARLKMKKVSQYKCPENQLYGENSNTMNIPSFSSQNGIVMKGQNQDDQQNMPPKGRKKKGKQQNRNLTPMKCEPPKTDLPLESALKKRWLP